MGVSVGCLAVKTSKQNFDVDEFTKLIFGTTAIKVDEYVDTRNDENFSIIPTPDGFVWLNSTLIADEVFDGKTERLQKIYTFFDKPAFMIALNEYDSGGTYGYAIIETGKVVRKRCTFSYSNTIDEGTPLALEKEWLSGRKIIAGFDEDSNLVELTEEEIPEELDEDEEELVRAVVHPDTNEIAAESEISQILHTEVMLHYFGYTIWDRNEREIYYYTLQH